MNGRSRRAGWWRRPWLVVETATSEGGTAARVALWAAGLALVGVHVWVALDLPAKVPIIFPDEGGYLGNATFMARGYGHPINGYFGGYSLLLLPAAILRSDPHAFYTGALITNAALSLATAAFAYLLVRQLFPNVHELEAALAAAAVVLQPFVFTVASLAMSENALIPTTLLTAWLLARYVEKPSIVLGLAGAVAASFTFWVSPRGGLVVGAFVLAHLVLLVRSRRSSAAALAIVATLAGSITTSFFFNRALRGRAQVQGLDGAHGVPSLARASTWRDFVAGVGGRLGYLGVATLGLALIGVCVAAWWAFEPRGAARSERCSARAIVGVFASVSVLTTVAWPALTACVSRIDQLYYGRYAEGVALPLVAIGGGWLVSRRVWRTGRYSIVWIAAAASSAIVLFEKLARLFPHPPPVWFEVPINVLAVLAVRKLTHATGYSDALLIGALVVGAVLLLCLIDSKLSLIAVAVVFAVAASSVYFQYRRPPPNLHARNNGVASSVHRLEQLGITTRCITYQKFAFAQLSVFLLPKWRFELARPRPKPACRALVLSSTSRPGTPGDWRLVATEASYFPNELWIDLSAFPAQLRSRLATATLPDSP